jgi:hypothetical protein
MLKDIYKEKLADEMSSNKQINKSKRSKTIKEAVEQ